MQTECGALAGRSVDVSLHLGSSTLIYLLGPYTRLPCTHSSRGCDWNIKSVTISDSLPSREPSSLVSVPRNANASATEPSLSSTLATCTCRKQCCEVRPCTDGAGLRMRLHPRMHDGMVFREHMQGQVLHPIYCIQQIYIYTHIYTYTYMRLYG